MLDELLTKLYEFYDESGEITRIDFENYPSLSAFDFCENDDLLCDFICYNFDCKREAFKRGFKIALRFMLELDLEK